MPRSDRSKFSFGDPCLSTSHPPLVDSTVNLRTEYRKISGDRQILAQGESRLKDIRVPLHHQRLRAVAKYGARGQTAKRQMQLRQGELTCYNFLLALYPSTYSVRDGLAVIPGIATG